MENPYRFQIGRAYRSKQAASAEEYLRAALQAERYLSAAKITTPEGCYWQSAPEESTSALQRMGLYGGSAGILYFYWKLYQVTGEESFLQTAEEALSYIDRHLEELFPTRPATLAEAGAGVSLGLGVLGVAGIGWVLEELYAAGPTEQIRDMLARIASYYQHTARTEGAGAYWTGSTTMLTDTAIILFLLEYQKLLPSEAIRTLIDRAGTWFVSQALEQAEGGVRYAGLECVWEGIKPNFEVGTAGSGYLLTRLYEDTGRNLYLQKAEECALFLKHCLVPQAKGALLPFRLDSEEPIFYLGNCSGPAGSSRLFYLLYRLTGKTEYRTILESMVEGMEAVGAPEHQSAGLWYNVDFCCGHAGILQFYASLYVATGKERYRELARRTASVLLGEREEKADGAASWCIADERIRPDKLSRPLGYYLGAAGIGAALLQMYLLEKDAFCWKRLADDPYPEQPRKN